MGLAGRKEKQRIGEDPRNTRWANDTSSPGYKMLAGMGWTPNTGLGSAAARLGMVSGSSTPSATLGLGLGVATPAASSSSSWKRLPTAILPTAKSDTRGLGASLQSSALSTFEIGTGAPAFVTAGKGKEELAKAKAARGGGLDDLFARLNRGGSSTSGTSTPEASSATKVIDEEENAEVHAKEKERKRAEKAAKKALRALDGEGEKKGKKRKRTEKDAEQIDVAVKVADACGTEAVVTVPVPAAAVSTSSSGTPILNPRMASRARHLASKRLATSQNATAMAEILGLVAPAPPASSAATVRAPLPALVEPQAPIDSAPAPSVHQHVDDSVAAAKEPAMKKGKQKRRKEESAAVTGVDMDMNVLAGGSGKEKKRKRDKDKSAVPEAELVEAKKAKNKRNRGSTA